MANESSRETGKVPSPGIALLLGLLGPWGIGQFYLRQTRRALLWLIVPSVAVILEAVALPWLGGLLGYGLVFVFLFGGVFVAWIGSLVDLRFVSAANLRRAVALKVFGYWVGGTALAIAVRLPLRALVIEAFKILAASMQPGLSIGDHIMTDKLVLRLRKPKRGEAIVFKFPERPEQDFVKRVIAIPGDTLLVKGGHPLLNGWEVPHCVVGTTTMPDTEGGTSSGELDLEYLDGEAYLTFFDEQHGVGDTQGPFTVADNEVWVLGDNRNNSHDSRFWFGGRGGGVPLDLVKARALFRWLSVTDAGVDWSRFGTGLADPLLPVSMKSLEGGLKKCLEQRPSRERTVPPR